MIAARRLTVVLLVPTAFVVLWRAMAVLPPTHVVIVTLDTTRADRLSPYGYLDAAMPALERLAREGVLFDHAFSVAPLTLPSHTSLFTGLIPPRHGVRDNAATPLAERYATLAEVVRGRGYCTGAFVSSVVLDSDRGLAQGFDRYRGVPADDDGRRSPQRRADAVMDEAIRWLDEDRACPIFLWAHLYDAHRPYEPPEPYRAHYADPYQGEIAFAESQLSRLLGALERRRLLDNTLVVVAGDHGESLGEHGEENHGMFLYESVLRIPLIIRLPQPRRSPGTTAARVADVVRVVDVMPTVLDVLGMSGPPTDGVSLVEVMNGRHLDLEAYAESMYPVRFGRAPLRALRDGRFTLIEGPCPELYDVAADPFEQRNVLEEKRQLASAMSRTLTKQVLEDAPPASPDPASADLRRNLQTLGYVSGSSGFPEVRDCKNQESTLTFQESQRNR